MASRKPICSWCQGHEAKAANGRYIDIIEEYAGVYERGNLCSRDCAKLWTTWAQNRLRAINARFPLYK